jgi:hypothetical protein
MAPVGLAGDRRVLAPMTELSRLDLMLQRRFEEMERERVEAEARVEALRDPFKTRRTEPGRAVLRTPGGKRIRRSNSLGGEHS